LKGLKAIKPQIIGGEEVTDIKKFAYHVGILVNNDEMKCSGVLINANWVLTAASCVSE
jgi:secreted trypsin-like serine protease